jgi:hypothetical protein
MTLLAVRRLAPSSAIEHGEAKSRSIRLLPRRARNLRPTVAFPIRKHGEEPHASGGY